MSSPFHVGEQWVQSRAGVREKAEQIGSRIIRSAMPEQHREFFERLPAVLLGAVDSEGQPHASILWGTPGFMWSPHPALLCVEASVQADDPVASLMRPQAAIGLLGLEMPTRRRNRVNGRIVECDERGFSVAVAQSFGNCPKYIQARHWQASPRMPGLVVAGEGLDDRWLALVQTADTLFIASQSPDAQGGGADISHRGGAPGFVRYGEDGRLWLPDYGGNQLFNTLGNLVREPRCGLLFMDFDSGDLLQLQAKAELVWPEQYAAFNANPPPSAERMLALTPGRWSLRRGRLPLSFSAPEASPFLPRAEV
ncbi:pyridoxamine 5'-phosphate oxidase family protein [Stutzerimonas stutzeri]|uniref:pyridoxamine 5'-phosphate oxidase family protein n=1 Tax=Stutzerimonas stutzeri TaxID=316 RepID=UPI00210A25FF|nr:pyridoxamine 5'-phosphate oxidase family protein [Stutzerimonas stutzeri]MCQ4257699.1 pyridoxamine 5'-phosphate oxidase family protein [Stutzerimonas stutzeri]